MNAKTFDFVTSQITADVWYFTPEIVLAATACLVLLLDLTLRKRDSRQLTWVALAGVIASAVLLISIELGEEGSRALFRAWSPESGAMTASGMIVHDSFASFFKLIFLTGTAIAIVLTYVHEPMADQRFGEFYAILLTAVIGMFLMASASDMLVFVLGIEMVSIPSYVLVTYLKQNKNAAEASLKYVLYGSVMTGLMLYGFSLLYGLTGTTQLAHIGQLAVTEGGELLPYLFAVVTFLVLGGFAYKMSMVPMHFWTPDVYQGAPTPVTAWLSVASKAAGFALFMRFLVGFGAVSGLDFDWKLVIGIFAAATMTLGNLGALWQNDLKRMFAYSSIAHAGYLLMGCCALFGSTGYTGASAIGFYLLAYMFMNFGVFTLIIIIANHTGREDVEGCRGLGQRAPFLAASFTVFLFALIGMPPTGGFVGKFQLFMVCIEEQMYWLVAIAGINTAISVGYYARIIKVMYLEQSDEVLPPLTARPLARMLVTLQLIGILILGTVFSWVTDWTEKIRMHAPPAGQVQAAHASGLEPGGR